MLHRALDRVEHDGLAGLVIGNDDPRTFTAGADLSMILRLLQAGDWTQLEAAARAFQDTSLRITAGAVSRRLRAVRPHARRRVRVLAPRGPRAGARRALYGSGGGRRGLDSGGGGTTELLFRFSSELGPYAEADPFEAVRRAFQLIAMGTTSTSALEARKLGFLRDADRVTMNRDRLIADAVARVMDLAPDYVPPLPRTITAMGKDATRKPSVRRVGDA